MHWPCLQLSWQTACELTISSRQLEIELSWHVAAELTAAKQTLCIWSKLTYSTWSWQTTEELIVYRLAYRLHSSWQSAVELTYSTWSWQTTEELIVYRLAYRLHSSWQSAVELTVCGLADRLWLIQRVAAHLRVCVALSLKVAARTDRSQMSWLNIAELIVYTSEWNWKNRITAELGWASCCCMAKYDATLFITSRRCTCYS